MENWCRLCANEKHVSELIYKIDDEFLNVKQKLIDCCRWDKIADETDQIGIPKMICTDCIEKLEQSWSFAESVLLAQQRINMHLMDVKPIVSLEIEKFDTPFIEKAREEDLVKVEINEYAESISPLPNLDFDFDDSMCPSPAEDFKFDGEKDFNSTLTGETDTAAKIDCDLLTLLSDNDKNANGTIDKQKIAELNLDDWSILPTHCWMCGKIFNKSKSFKSHFRTKHPDATYRFDCTLCSASANRRYSLQNHIIKFHRPYLKYCCKKCNIFYWDLKKLKKHMSGFHPNQPAPIHVELNTNQPTQTLCEICGKNFTNQSQLKYHARSHMPIEQRRSFECYLCRATFAYKKSLLTHIATHSGKKPQFQCDVCQSNFSRTDALRRHALIHLGQLPHRCSYCDKGFRTKFNLKVHERTHTGERPYQCIYCSYRSADGPNMGKHIKQKHKHLIGEQKNAFNTMTTMPFHT